jgi:hypothetical protein
VRAGFEIPRLEAEAGNGGNALEERRWAWEFDPKPSRDSARERNMYLAKKLLRFPRWTNPYSFERQLADAPLDAA